MNGVKIISRFQKNLSQVITNTRNVSRFQSKNLHSSSRNLGGASHAHHDSHHHDDHHGHGHGHGHGHHEPHVPEFYDKLGKACLIVTYLWVMYRFKEDKGQFFGLYQPWLHEHHHEHLHYELGSEHGDTMPTLAEEEHEDVEEEEEEEDEE